MNETKLTVRVPSELLENIRKYAKKNDTTISELIKGYLRRFPGKDTGGQTPIVSRLSGVVSQRVAMKDYSTHLEEKYGQ